MSGVRTASGTIAATAVTAPIPSPLQGAEGEARIAWVSQAAAEPTLTSCSCEAPPSARPP
ncbi:hypothetical protein MMUR_66220 [Mycolicibacterium murale]|uniref:Uncharacterized protein n=1 Tax=Mycolicibacterium murale TaxID=182220 RepID=A0A7I9WEP5_9MYCO|nr:hypothetical protein MMUR_00950 [Mycolicibacterium murale]GFG62486.1 hypothetical protein MMUR_66220 [Mycolicibacterium murale]